jgi:hypothetical protein
MRLSGAPGLLGMLLAAAGAGRGEGQIVSMTGGSGTATYNATFVRSPPVGAQQALVAVTVTLNSQACGGACGWLSIGIGNVMVGSKVFTCFQGSSSNGTQLCPISKSGTPPACGTQSQVVGAAANAGGNFVCAFNGNGIGGVSWSDSQPIVIAYGKGAAVSSMDKHAPNAGFSLGTVSFNSAAQTGAGVVSAVLLALATLL